MILPTAMPQIHMSACRRTSAGRGALALLVLSLAAGCAPDSAEPLSGPRRMPLPLEEDARLQASTLLLSGERLEGFFRELGEMVEVESGGPDLADLRFALDYMEVGERQSFELLVRLNDRIAAMKVFLFANTPDSLDVTILAGGSLHSDINALRSHYQRDWRYLGEGRVDLGDHSVKVFQPGRRIGFRTDFHLEGRSTFDAPEAFDRFFASNHRRVREQVMVVLRGSPPEDLADPALTLLRRRLVAQVNRTVGFTFLESVDIQGFTLHELVGDATFVLR